MRFNARHRVSDVTEGVCSVSRAATSIREPETGVAQLKHHSEN